MQKISFLSIIVTGTILSLNINSHCMENDKFGPIDKLMISRAVQEKGYHNLRQAIENHEFDKLIYGHHNPFCIIHRCVKNDESPLSTRVFHMKNIAETETVQIENALNKHHTAIDEHTRWAAIKDGSKDVLATARFHNKITLLKVLLDMCAGY